VKMKYICSVEMKQQKTNNMTTLRNNEKFAMVVNKDNGVTVHFGYTVYGEDTCTGRKVYKTEKAAQKFTDKYLN